MSDAHTMTHLHKYEGILNVTLVIVICKTYEDDIKYTTDKRFSWRRQKEQFRTMFGTLLYFSKLKLIPIIVFTDYIQNYTELLETLAQWPQHQLKRLQFIMRQVDAKLIGKDVLRQWRPCDWAKLYLMEMLQEYDSIIYLDSDAIFLGPVEHMSTILSSMNVKHTLAAAPEPMYVYENQTDFIPSSHGINTGLLAYNFTRLRTVIPKGIGNTLLHYTTKGLHPRHHQDLLNAYLKEHPEMLLMLSTRFNFLPSSCTVAADCEECKNSGLVVLHGADGSFYRRVDPIYWVSECFAEK